MKIETYQKRLREAKVNLMVTEQLLSQLPRHSDLLAIRRAADDTVKQLTLYIKRTERLIQKREQAAKRQALTEAQP